MSHLGTVPAGTTLYIPFATYDSNDPSASVTLTGLAVTDIEIYKDGSVTQRASDAGYTLLDTDGIDFDGITGIHGFSIDLSDNTDAGFYAVGSQYWVVVSSVTVDAATVNFIAATFRIGPAEGLAGYQPVDVAAISADATAANNAESFFDGTGYAGTNNVIPTVTTLTGHTAQTGDSYARLGAPAGASVSADIAALNDPTAAAIADAVWDETLADHLGAGSTGSGLNSASSAGDPWNTALPGAYGAGTAGKIVGDNINAPIATVDTVVDAIKAVTDNLPDSGALTSIAQASVCTETRLAELDAGNLPTDIAAVKTDTGNLVTRITATLFSGITSMAQWLGLIAGKQTADATALTEIKATGAGSGTYDPTTDSNEALRDTAPMGTAMRGTDNAATAANLATAQADLDILTGADGATLATVQGNYAPATAAAMTTAQNDLDLLTGADGATLATSQPNYAPATAAALTTHDGKLDTVDTVVDAIKAITDAIGATAAANLARALGSAAVVAGTVDTVTNGHAPTTTEFQADDITEATADHYNGRVIIFLTGALAGQATDITDYAAVGGIGQFTVTALTESPANNDTFIVV